MKLKKTSILKLLIITIGIMGLVLCIFLLPWLAQYMTKQNSQFATLKYPIMSVVYITAIPFYIALYQGYHILKHIETKSAFSQHAVNSLKYIKYCTSIITVVYIIGLIILLLINILYISIIVAFILIIFAAMTVTLLASVLQELLTQALEIKAENDLMV